MQPYEKCELCSFPVQNHAVTYHHGNSPCRLMVIGQAPSLDEELPSPRNALELSKKAQWFIEMMKDLGAKPEDFHFTNLALIAIN